jgi:hypothetical protein
MYDVLGIKLRQVILRLWCVECVDCLHLYILLFCTPSYGRCLPQLLLTAKMSPSSPKSFRGFSQSVLSCSFATPYPRMVFSKQSCPGQVTASKWQVNTTLKQFVHCCELSSLCSTISEHSGPFVASQYEFNL